jgi:hypothetical protein
MRMLIISVVFVFVGTAILSAQEETATALSGSFLIVKVSDHKKDVSFKVMNQQEYKTLMAEIGTEGRAWDKAMNATEKEWKANPETSKKSFPRNALAPKRASISQQFNSQEKATEKVAALEKREAEMLELDKKRAEEKEKRKTGGQQKPASVTRAEQSKQAIEDQRNQQMKKAIEMFESKLVEVMADQAANPPKFAAPPGKPAK